TEGGTGERPAPLQLPFRGHDTDIEPPVVGRRGVEHLHVANRVRHVADEHAAGLAREPPFAVDLNASPKPLGAEFPCPRRDIGGPPKATLQWSIRIANHQRIPTGAGHYREPLAVECSDVELAALPV